MNFPQPLPRGGPQPGEPGRPGSAEVASASAAMTLAGLEEIYRDLDARIAAEKPSCAMSGRCCRFRESGLTLFASRLEVALWSRDWDSSAHPWMAPDVCPFLVGGRCENRDDRPLGCRVYFCDPRWGGRAGSVYERFHARIRRLHDEAGLTYAYGPALVLLAGLRAQASPAG